MLTEDAYSSGHLVLSHFGTCKCSNVETNISWTCLVSGLLSFEHPSVLLFLLRTKVASVRFWKKESWWLWLGIWVLDFDRMLNITYWVLGGGLVSDIEVRKNMVTWPVEIVRASNGDIGTLQICIYFCMFWVLFFSQISINWVINGKNSNEFCWIIKNIYTQTLFLQKSALPLPYGGLQWII